MRIAIVLALVLVAGCVEPVVAVDEDGQAVRVIGEHMVTSKGVECVWRTDGYSGGLSCNWEKYNREQATK